MLDLIFDAIGAFVDFIGKIISTFINGIMSLQEHVVDYFRGLRLRKGHDTPFVGDAKKQQLKDMLHKAPVKNVSIFEATYNEDTDEISNYRFLEADEIDNDIRSILENETLVVLS